MLQVYLLAKYPHTIFFVSDKEYEKLLLDVLTRLAEHDVEIDDAIMGADTDMYHCRSSEGDFTVFYDGDVQIYAPSVEANHFLLRIFNSPEAQKE